LDKNFDFYDEKTQRVQKFIVYIFMKNNPNKRKSEVADRFIAVGIKRATIYRWIKLKPNFANFIITD
jgi:hypothetical protein